MERQKLEGAATDRAVNDPFADERFAGQLGIISTTKHSRRSTPQKPDEHDAWMLIGNAVSHALQSIVELWP